MGLQLLQRLLPPTSLSFCRAPALAAWGQVPSWAPVTSGRGPPEVVRREWRLAAGQGGGPWGDPLQGAGLLFLDLPASLSLAPTHQD